MCSETINIARNPRALSLDISLYDSQHLICHWVVTEIDVQNTSFDVPTTNDVQATATAKSWLSFWFCIKSSTDCRLALLNYCNSRYKKPCMSSKITVNQAVSEVPLDYSWNERILKLVNEKSVVDTVMSYLSTLGGAFSSLGDKFPFCAEKAGQISRKQFELAMRLGDEPLVARCQLYLALSLMQLEKLETAKQLILNQYLLAHKLNDTRLKNMCRGVWAKLRYMKKIRKETGSLISQ